jgi:hypothetical protein
MRRADSIGRAARDFVTRRATRDARDATWDHTPGFDCMQFPWGLTEVFDIVCVLFLFIGLLCWALGQVLRSRESSAVDQIACSL